MNIRNYISGLATGAKKVLVKRSPELMLGLGIGTAFAAIVTAVTATPKALKSIQDEKDKKNLGGRREDGLNPIVLTTTEKVKEAWKYYIPTAILFASSAALVLGSHKLMSKRVATAAAACSLAETALRQYKDSIEENVVPEIKEKIEETVSQKQIQRAPDPRDVYIQNINPDGVLMCESITGYLFRCDKETIRSAANSIKQEMLNDGYGGTRTLGDFFDILGLRVVSDMRDAVGWNISGNCLDDISFSPQVAANGDPCLVLRYDRPPIHDFEKAYIY